MKREAPPKGGVLVWGGTVLPSIKVATMLIGMSRTLLVLLFVSVAAFGAEDKAYRITLPDGTVEFSDKPQAGAKEIKVPPAQTYQAPHLAPLDASTQKRPVSPFVYDALAITSPAPDQTFRGDTGGNIPVQVTIEPGLRSGDTLVIRLDGKTAASGSGVALPDRLGPMTASISPASTVRDTSSSATTWRGGDPYRRPTRSRDKTRIMACAPRRGPDRRPRGRAGAAGAPWPAAPRTAQAIVPPPRPGR